MRLPLLAAVLCTVAAGVVSSVQPVPVQAQAAPPAAPKKIPSPPMTASVTLNGGAVSIGYGAPSMRGRKIFGGLVPYGEVWRTGANSATTLKTAVALQIGDLNVPAGTYTLYSLPAESGWTLIVNKQTGQWGTVYDKSQDLGRVPMSAGSNAAPVETFVIDFEKTTGSATELHLKWADVDASVQVTAGK